jgi:predicted aminopeptidase
MREAKRAGFAQLKKEYEALKERWGGFAGYDRIMGAAPGNSLLASITAYSKYVPGFERVLASEGNDLQRFYAAVRGIAKLPREQRCRLLTDGLPGAPPSSEECSPRK